MSTGRLAYGIRTTTTKLTYSARNISTVLEYVPTLLWFTRCSSNQFWCFVVVSTEEPGFNKTGASSWSTWSTGTWSRSVELCLMMPLQSQVLSLQCHSLHRHLGRVQQLTGWIGWTIGTAYVRQLSYVDCSVSPTGNRCHFLLLDKDESCPTADLSNIGRPNGPAYSTGELLSMLLGRTKTDRLEKMFGTCTHVCISYKSNRITRLSSCIWLFWLS